MNSEACLARTLDTVRGGRDYLSCARSPGRCVGPVSRAWPTRICEALLLHLRGVLSGTGRRVLQVDRRLRVRRRPRGRGRCGRGRRADRADHMLWIKPRAGPPRRAAGSGRGQRRRRRVRSGIHVVLRGAPGRSLRPTSRLHDPLPRVAWSPGSAPSSTGVTVGDAARAAEVAFHDPPATPPGRATPSASLDPMT